MLHIISANPIHNFSFELHISHINVLIEGFLTVEPLNVVPDIWLCTMGDRNYDFASRYNIVDKIRGFLVFLLELFCATFRDSALVVNNYWS